MVHHQDVAMELNTRLLTAQHEIETLCTQLRKLDATIRGYMRMVEGQANDLYASDTNTWTTTSSVQSSSKEPVVSSHLPLRIPQSLGVTCVRNNVALVIACLMIDDCVCVCYWESWVASAPCPRHHLY
jgi:hypothetical protein